MTKSLLRRMTGWLARIGDSSARAVASLRARAYTFERDPDLALAQNGDNFLAIP